jgi:hypothetical protein
MRSISAVHRPIPVDGGQPLDQLLVAEALDVVERQLPAGGPLGERPDRAGLGRRQPGRPHRFLGAGQHALGGQVDRPSPAGGDGHEPAEDRRRRLSGQLLEGDAATERPEVGELPADRQSARTGGGNQAGQLRVAPRQLLGGGRHRSGESVRLATADGAWGHQCTL